MTGVLALAMAACLPVSSEASSITAGDLAAADPVFEAASPRAFVAFAPSPGSERWFRAGELRRLALRLHVAPATGRETCFARRMSVLSPGQLLEAMRRALPESAIEVLDFSREPAPEGDLQFSANALRRRSTETFWNGFVIYGGAHRFPVWTKVRVETPPPLVLRGGGVTVEVWSGATHLKLEALAESSGVAGERVAVRNPISKKRFFARVSGPASVSIGRENP